MIHQTFKMVFNSTVKLHQRQKLKLMFLSHHK